MNITQNEIASHRARLREEIMERECLLAALDVMEKYAARGHAPAGMELGRLFAAFVPSAQVAEVKELPTPAASVPAPAPTALPPRPLVERYLHPELKTRRFSEYGANAQLVNWAIQRMTDDYSVHDIAALLKREGRPLGSPEISVVLTRLKGRGEIEEIRRSAGPKPAVFRKPENATSPVTAPADSAADRETTATPVEAS